MDGASMIGNFVASDHSADEFSPSMIGAAGSSGSVVLKSSARVDPAANAMKMTAQIRAHLIGAADIWRENRWEKFITDRMMEHVVARRNPPTPFTLTDLTVHHRSPEWSFLAGC